MTNPAITQSQKFSWTAFMAIGFRPFYLAGALYAAIGMIVWIAYLFDKLEISGPMEGVLWHSHELIFGFAVAILVGFLFTAVRNWTGLPTPSGKWLAALLLLWLAGRVGLIFGSGPLVPIIDLAFLPLAALSIAIPLIKSGNRRNYFTFILMGVLTLANCAFYAIAYEWIDIEPTTAFLVAVDVFAIFMTVIGGRIIPLFSNNATGCKRAKRHQSLEYVIVAGMVLVLISDAVFGLTEDQALPRAALLGGLALLHFIKVMAWRPQITLGDPILWILPLAYLWIPIALALRSISMLDGPVEQILALHSLTVGAMGSMMLAMMTRSALGHTGRKITAGKWETAMFVAITLGAVIRIFGPLILPQFYLMQIALSALLWIIAFTLFALRYWPVVTRPRF